MFRCHIQGLSNIIAAFDNSLFFDAVGIPQKRKAIIARRNDQIPAPPGQPYLNLQPDRINQRLLAHRLYPAACPQYGQSSINAKPWVKGLSCQPLSIRNGYLYINSPDISCFFAGFPHLLQDHLPRHLIDGRTSYRLLQTWLCYCPNTLAAPKGSFAPFRTLYLAIYQHAVGDIRVIPAIFFNRAGYAGRRPVFLRGIRYFYVIDLKGEHLPVGKPYLYLICLCPGKQHLHCCLGCCLGACSCCISPCKPLLCHGLPLLVYPLPVI